MTGREVVVGMNPLFLVLEEKSLTRETLELL